MSVEPDDVAAVWDAEALVFDAEAHHSLADPVMRAAWWDGLAPLLPPPPASIADLGCGTGTLAVLLAEHGYDIVGLDLSPRMIGLARAKAERHHVAVRFEIGDAADPRIPAVDVILTRHVLWALPEPARALERWAALLAPGGRLVLVEGLWSTGAGLESDHVRGLVPLSLPDVVVHELSDPALWGHKLVDSRYVLVARS